MVIVFIISLVIIGFYVYIFFLFIIGWTRIELYTKPKKFVPEAVSVIIPFRNEKQNLEALIAGLKAQKYPWHEIEFILVNDHSSDQSSEIVKQLIGNDSRFEVVDLDEGEMGKKAALAKAVNYSKGKILLFMDADCIIRKDWVVSMVTHMIDNNYDFVAGDVQLDGNAKLFDRLQELEFAGLLASTAGAIGISKPFMSNAANMACRKDAYMEALQHRNDSSPSGDDVFLLHKLVEQKKNIGFLKGLNMSVRTKTKSGIREYVNQRARWASKGKYYKNQFSKLVGYSVLAMNLLLLILLFFVGVQYILLLFLSGMFLKIMVESFLFVQYANVFGRKENVVYLPILSFFNLFYVPYIALKSLFGYFEWKGRKYSV
jgi:cellulose synthase/poly-beta-1,6-N-acetylglucosamine synthase-like glycosyltransferase